MSLRNRVTPQGAIEAVAARGTMMGNRGILHDVHGVLGRARWRHQRWVACVTEFRGRNRKPLMRAGRYTELFFLDEAVALAAGHRPCKECRRLDYEAFVTAWGASRRNNAGTSWKADAIDAVLHADRIGLDRRSKRHSARLGDLPDGCLVVLDETPDDAWLVWRDGLHRWTHGGYTGRRDLEPGAIVSVLTPRASVDALCAGYRPRVHSSAG